MSNQAQGERLKARFKVGDIVRWNALALHGDERNGWKIEYMDESEGLSPIWAVTKNKELRSAVEMDLEPCPTHARKLREAAADPNEPEWPTQLQLDKAEIARLREMLRVARCPNKDAKGHEQTWQCQWCDEQRALTQEAPHE